MRRVLITLMLLSAVFALGWQLARAADETETSETAEPPLRLVITSDGRQIEAEAGQRVKLSGENPEITVTVLPTRRFAHGGMQFDYPHYFTFEADMANKDLKNWTLSGNDAKIMLFVSKAALSAENFAKAAAQRVGGDESQVEHTQRRIGGASYDGSRLPIRVAGAELVQEVFSLEKGEDGLYRIVVLQDALDKQGKHSAEWGEIESLLSKSFKQVEQK